MGEHFDVLNREGMPQGSIELPGYLFDAEVSEHALYRAVTTYLANQRQGNASTKSRSEVRRTGKKHHRQKGIGIARRGSLGSPLLRGGGGGIWSQASILPLESSQIAEALGFSFGSDPQEAKRKYKGGGRFRLFRA